MRLCLTVGCPSVCPVDWQWQHNMQLVGCSLGGGGRYWLIASAQAAAASGQRHVLWSKVQGSIQTCFKKPCISRCLLRTKQIEIKNFSKSNILSWNNAGMNGHLKYNCYELFTDPTSESLMRNTWWTTEINILGTHKNIQHVKKYTYTQSSSG